MQVKTDGSALCCYNVAIGLNIQQPAMPTRTVQRVSTSSTTREDDGFPPLWPTSWTCLQTTKELSKLTTTSPCPILLTR